MDRFYVTPLRFPNDLHPTCARVELGLTMYLADPVFWAREGATQALRAFLSRAPSAQLEWFTTSAIGEWRRVGSPQVLDTLTDSLSAWSGALRRARHGFFFQLADDSGAPGVGFYYREIDPERSPRAAVIEITLPQQSDPGELFQLALELANLGPYWSGVGGYQARWNWLRKRDAFSQIYMWCGRFLGLDVQDSELVAFAATQGLPGSNWLTLVSHGLADRAKLALAELAERRWTNDVAVIPTPHGHLFRAGAMPTGGDVNTLTYPRAYAEVARALAPAFIAEPPEHWGLFGGRGETKIWLNRLVDPQPWNGRGR